VLVGTAAVFFSWLQLGLFRNPDSFLCNTDGAVRLWINASALRWFFLIVIYGVFIPSTWKRTAVLSCSLLVLAVGLTAAGAFYTDRFCWEVFAGLYDLTILIGTGVAVAVFGTYRLESLQREAFQAQQLGQYRLKRLIGVGGMGEVHEAEH